ncbi:MAG: NfeD family protein [Gammaproteobacteria bacterium]|nr:MAG: NfeD family protein [Gammaproteobacteria bacterium]
MEFTPLWWHWIILGILLAMAEIFVPSFTLLWFGLGAALVGGLLFITPELSFTWQVLLWAVSSTAFTILWFRYFKPTMTDKTKAGISLEAVIGEAGQVIQAPQGNHRGMVRFPKPILGSQEWPCLSEETLNEGDRVFVRELSGNTFVVSTQRAG